MPQRGTFEHKMHSTMCRLYKLVFVQQKATMDEIEQPTRRRRQTLLKKLLLTRKKRNEKGNAKQ
jgi:hypothetical protein